MPGGDNTMLMGFSGSAPPAAIVTFGLFFLMQILVATGNTQLDDTEIIIFRDMIGIPEESTVQDKRPEAERPEELEPPPQLDPRPRPDPERDKAGPVIPKEPARPDVDPRGGFGVQQDGEFVPVARFEPRYPRRPAERGIEGETVVEFTVTAIGTTEGCTVVFEEPGGFGFGRAACAAVEKWKYRPRVVDGEALPVVGVQTLLTFRLADE